VRRLAAEEQLSWDDRAPFAPAKSLADALLEPTRIYVKPILAALEATGGAADGAIKALAHITGGGLSENIPRVLPPTLAATIDLTAWQPQSVFGWLARAGRLGDAEMLRTFNCGLGMVMVVQRGAAEPMMTFLREMGEQPVLIGEVTPPAGERSSAKGKGEAWAVSYEGLLKYQS
jgi:phosphoribosylformylglycinamidine cyclo-ligase